MSSTGSRDDPESSTDTADLVGRYHDVTAGDLDAGVDVLDEEVVLHMATGNDERRGRNAVLDEFATTLEQFPDFTVAVEAVVAQGETAASRWTITATGETADGDGSSDETVRLWGITMFEVEDGKIVEIWDRTDTDRVDQALWAGGGN